MDGRKKLNELTILNNFMFSAVMMENPDNCRELLEYVLGLEIDRVEVVAEKCMVYHPEYKGVRLDVYVKEQTEDGMADRHFDVEMQVTNRKIFKRSRYYHSQMDMEILGTGLSYEELPDTYVVFICDFDPVGLKKYKYTRYCTFKEDNTCEYEDGTHTVFLNTKGTNDAEVPESLVKLLKYIGATVEDSDKDYDDPLVSRLQESVKRIKSDREMGARYMLLEEMMKDEYNAGKKEGIIKGKREEKLELINDFLAQHGEIPKTISDKLADISDEAILRNLVKKAVTVSDIKEFEAELDKLPVSE